MLNTYLFKGAAISLLLSCGTAYAQLPETVEYKALPDQVLRLDGRTAVSSQQSEVTRKAPSTALPGLLPADESAWPASHGVPAMKGKGLPSHLRQAQPQAIGSAMELTGKWINQYPMLNLSLSGGATAIITATEGSNEVTISNFWRSGGSIKAILDAAAGTLTVKSQVVTKRTDGTTMSIAPINMSNGYPLRSQTLTLRILADGKIVCDTPWGIYYDRTQPGADDNPAYEKDDYANVYTSMTFERGTSTMSHVNLTRNDTTEYPVIATQVSANVLEVKNFLGYGQTVDLILNRDNSYTCRTQVALVEGSTPYSTRGDLVLNENKVPTSWNTTFSFPASTTDPKLIQFGNMSLFNGTSYWVGLIENARLNLTFAPSFPAPYTPFEGSGTEADPYLIKTYNDLAQLADRVNSDNNYNYTVISGTDTVQVAKPFLGKYFRLTADLDMTGYDFTPIGNGTHFFAGNFNGDGHTIKGLNIYGGDGYAALFGYVDQAGMLRNLTLDNITSISSRVYTAALASRCDGAVENCHLRNSNIKVNNGAQGAGGLTGTVNKMTGCTVTDTEVYAGDGYGGGLTAQAFGPITNCHVSGTNVSGMVYNATNIPPFGGLTATSNDAITDCSFAGTVMVPYDYYPATIGGLAGIIQTLGKGVGITRSVAAGRFIGASGQYSRLNRIGGLAGMCASDITDSYAAGEVYAYQSQTAGGLTGIVQYMQSTETGATIQPAFSNNYSNIWLNVSNSDFMPTATTCQELFGSSDGENPPTVSNTYFNSDITNLGSTKYALTTAQLTSAQGPSGFNSQTWMFTANAYPRLRNMASRAVSDLTASAVLFTDGAVRDRVTRNLQLTKIGNTEFGFIKEGVFSTTGHYAKVEGNNLVLNNELLFGNDTIVMRCGNTGMQYVMLMAPVPWQGYGSEASPWLIQNKADMLALAKMTSESKVSFPGTYYKMTADIDIEYDENFNGISSTNTSGRSLFHGTFDGDGHTLHKLKIGRLVWTTRPEDDPAGIGKVNTTVSKATYIGLFGEIANDGVVKNVNIAADCRYEVFASAGAIAGFNYGLIENCRNYADIWGFSSWIGGITGQNQKGGKVIDCFNAGNVTTGNRNAGGICSQSLGLISGCANTGSVRAISLYQAAGKNQIRYAGGISGGLNGGEIVNCFNSGSVFALEGYAGGLAGVTPKATTSSNYFNSLRNNVNVGVVDCGVGQLVGGISGGKGTDGTIENNYYDATLAPQGAIEGSAMEGMSALRTQALVNGQRLNGLEAPTWNFTANSYPVPVKYADEPSVKTARNTYILFAEGQDRLHVESEATLSQTEGLVWSNSITTNGFTISGNKLLPPANATSIVNDSITGSMLDCSRSIPVLFIPAAPWQGEGTEANPYLIPDANLWNAIGAMSKQTGDSYENIHFKVTKDIDFGGNDIEQIAIDPSAFKGTIDGDGHTLSNFTLTGSQLYTAPVGNLAAEGTLKNLVLKGKITITMASGSYSYAGGLVGKCYGKVINCVNMSEIVSNKGYVGGIAGQAYGGALFEGCKNRGTVSTNASAGYLGGIAGNVAENVTFRKCGNEGVITSTGGTGYFGGIAGYSYESTYDSCYNTSDITLEKGTNIAGIVGYLSGSKNASRIYYFNGCYNTGNLTARSCIGGITAYTGSTVGAAVSQFNGCYNTGNLTSTYTSSGSPAAAGIAAKYTPGSAFINCRNSGTIKITGKTYGIGGIVGQTGGVATKDLPVLLDHCTNSGDIIAGGTSGYWAGGIIAHANDFVTVSDCSNTGNISANYGAGGIAGALWGNSAVITDCYNTGNVTVDTRWGGGIVGTQGVVSPKTASASVTQCWNSGSIKSLNTTVGTANTNGHGIGGIAGQLPCLIENCANFGTVEGATMVGGILGEPVMNKTSARTRINSCYNAAPVIAQPTGHKAGITVTSQTDFWGEHNSLTNSYYATDWGVSDDETGTAKTIGELCSTAISDSWALIGDYTLPVVASQKNSEGWKAMAAAIVLHSGNNFDNVKRNFHVGTPQGVTWTLEPANAPLSIDGNKATWTREGFNGEIVLTAHCSDFSHSWTLKASETTSVSAIDLDEADVAQRLWFTTDGLQTAEPTETDGKLYIVVTIYKDGTKKVERRLNK